MNIRYLFGLLFLLGYFASATAQRDAVLWPFDKHSIWNQPIGENATYRDANLLSTNSLGDDVQFIFIRDESTIPETAQHNIAFDQPRCADGPDHDFPFYIQPDVIVPDIGPDNPYGNTPNANFADVDPVANDVWQGNRIARCEEGGPVFIPPWYQFPANRTRVDLEGDGLGFGAQGASNMSVLAGTLRCGELTGDKPIRHAVKINPWGHRFLHYSREIPGFRWPGERADNYAGNPANANRYNVDFDPDIVMGSLLAIPQDVSPESIGITSKPALKLFFALKYYGCYFTEDTSHDAWDLIVERDAETEFEELYGYTLGSPEWRLEFFNLLQALHVITNNTPDNIAGGGTPLQPLAPPFAPAGNTFSGVNGGAGTGLTAEYWNNTEMNGDPVVEGTDPQINFSWGQAGPSGLGVTDDFSARWRGYIQPRYTEQYLFSTESDDGIRLKINGHTLIDAFDKPGSVDRTADQAITMVANRKYEIEVTYKELSDNAHARLFWSSARQSLEAVPAIRLYPEPTITEGGFDPAPIVAAMPTGNVIAIRANNNLFVSRDETTGLLTATGTSPGEPASFYVQRVGRNRVALLSRTGGYLTAIDEDTPLTANAELREGPQRFEWVPLGGTAFALIADNGNGDFVSSNNGAASGLTADRNEIKNWETFNYVVRHDADKFIIIGGALLPVEIASFAGRLVNGVPRLNWTVALEEGFSHYVVERSADGVQWGEIGRVNSQQSTATPLYYSYLDQTAPSGTNYYRLRAVDLDDSFSHTEVVRITSSEAAGPSVTPNPNTGGFFVDFPLPGQEAATVTLRDFQGRELVKNAVTAFPHHLDTRVPPGVYLLVVETGARREFQRVVIH